MTENLCWVSVKDRGRGLYGSHPCLKPVVRLGRCERHAKAAEMAALKAAAYAHTKKKGA